jgi:hypothetical protein
MVGMAEDPPHDHHHGDHHHTDHHDRHGLVHEVREGIRSFFTNWHEYDASASTKLRLTLRNRALSTGRLRICCGHPGEPGC